MTRALIIGAGPGGLAAALALRRVGLDVAVFERRPELGDIGSGLTLWPNAMTALDQIGAGDAVRSIALPLHGIAMRTSSGEVLDRTSGDAMEQRYGGNGVAVHRAELIGALRGLLGDGVLHLGAACTSFRDDADGVTARFADGREARGDLLIGADGVHSGIAEQLFGPLTLRYGGFPVWRAVTDFDLRPPVGVTTMGRGAQFGLFQMTGGRVYWFASHNAPERSWLKSRPDKDRLLARFGGWHAPIKDVIAATDPASILVHGIYDRAPLQRWSVGRVTLLGDAAHPALPNLGQGACQALEDAAVLGACVRDVADIPAALRRYEARRIARANAMTVQARRLAWLGSWERQPLCWLRDRMIKWSPSSASDRHLRWLFTFDANASGQANGQRAVSTREACGASTDQTDVRSEQHLRSGRSASALE